MTDVLDRAAWHQALANHALHTTEPAGDPYVLGRWHHGRASLRGYQRELRVHVKTLIKRPAHPRKFLIVSRPRSGTTLLRGLLNQVPGIRCDSELLGHAVLAPQLYLNRLARTRGEAAYGIKVLSYQLFEVQNMGDRAPDFLEDLLADGYTLIHLRRDTFDQVMSLCKARTAQLYHAPSDRKIETREITIDPEHFMRQLRASRAAQDYEDLLFSKLPHLRLQYEDDLMDGAAHQNTVDRVCAAIGVPSGPVEAALARVAKKIIVTNLDALQALAAAPPDKVAALS